MAETFATFIRDDRGQDLIEYALLASFVSLIAILAITNIGISISDGYVFIDGQVKTIPGGGS